MFVAGGVGINPIISIMSDIYETNPTRRLELLYSVKTIEECLFRDRIMKLVDDSQGRIGATIFLSNQIQREATSTPGMSYKDRRLGPADLEKALEGAGISRGVKDNDRVGQDVFMCGPPSLEQAVMEYMTGIGFEESRIAFEKWW